MANIKSAKKRVKIAAIRTLRNSAQKNRMRTFIRKLEAALHSKDQKAANDVFPKVVSEIAKTAQKGIIKKNAASRTVSRLNAKIKALAS